MHIAASAAKLAGALQLAMRVLGKTSPVAHLSAIDDAVEFRCIDKIGSITARIGAVVGETGSAAFAASRAEGLLSTFPAESTVTISTSKTRAHVACGSSASQLALIPLDSLPTPPVISEVIGEITIGADNLSQLLAVEAAAANKGSTRFYLNGVCLNSSNGRLIAVASDGHRMLMNSVAADTIAVDRRLILPSKSVAILRSLLQQGKPGTLKIRRAKNLIAFNASGFSFVTTLIDSTYPDYARVIPVKGGNSVYCERKTMLRSLDRLLAASTVDPTLALVLLSWGNGNLISLSLAREPEVAQDSIDAKVEGSARIVVPISQLAGVLQQFGDVEIKIVAANDGEPIIIEGDRMTGVLVQSRWRSN